MIGAIVFIFGLLTGSFLNSVIFRLHKKQGFVRGRSKCPECKKELSVIELIPLISFLIQAGKCRKCKKPISVQYPLVELASGLLFLACYLFYGLQPRLVLSLVYICFLIIIFVYDFKYSLIPDAVVLPAVATALIGEILIDPSFTRLVLGGIIGLGFFLVQYLVSRGKWIGAGDLRLGLFMGFALGWPSILAAILIAYVIGAFMAVALVAFKKKSWKDQIPLGTFLTAAAVITMFFGDVLVSWYWY